MRAAAIIPAFAFVLATAACTEAPAVAKGVCLGPSPIGPDTTVTNVAYVDDCDAPLGTFGDIYEFTIATHSAILLRQTSSGFTGGLTLFTGTFANRATSRLVFDVVGNGQIGAKAFLPPGTYFIVAGSSVQGGGNYSLQTQPTSSSPCSDRFLNYTLRGADISGGIDLNDCPGATASVRQDAYAIWLNASEAITVTTTFDKAGVMSWRRSGYPDLPDLDIRALTANNAVAALFTAPDSHDPFSIHIIGEPVNTGAGAYTITVR